jgi:hypothetical protein
LENKTKTSKKSKDEVDSGISKPTFMEDYQKMCADKEYNDMLNRFV